jgi:fucose 4-O-acetylase-like acetyltransferase
MMTSDTIQFDGKKQSNSISELSIIKILALVLLIFVHSDLIVAYPKIMYPVQWFLLSVFFFIGGYLAYSSFIKREKSLKQFFKNKALTLYVPFVVAVIFYLTVEVAMGVQLNPMQVFSQLSMLNIFDQINSANNWGTLWFIPFLLLFMVITCVLERYVKSTKRQLLAISALLVFTTIFWLFETPLKLDSLFSQYLLVFVFGFYVSKFGLYQKLVSPKMAIVAVPLVAFFAFDFS